MFIDTHCHLNFSDYGNDLEDVIKEAVKIGVGKIICASSNIADSKEAIEVAGRFPGTVFATVGIHPQKTDPENLETLEKQIEQLSELSLNKQVVAIGECGLDFSVPPPGEIERNKEDQEYLFQKQIELAIKRNIPVIVHSRKAFDETVGILKRVQDDTAVSVQEDMTVSVHQNDTVGILRSAQNDTSFHSGQALRGVLHCYSGGKKDIKKIEELGFYFGIDGNVTYDEGLQSIVKLIPQDRLILETDSPFLTPVPYRGLRNNPSNVKLIYSFVASLRGISLEDLEEIVEQNVNRLFLL